MSSDIHPVRKIIKTGHSAAVTLPPYVLDHLDATVGDLIHYDLTVPNFVILHRVDVPPYAIQRDATQAPDEV